MEKREEKIKEEAAFAPSWRFFFWQAVVFVLILGLGVAAASRISVQEPIPLWHVLLIFFLTTLFVIFVTRYAKSGPGPSRGSGVKRIFFKIMFILAVFAGTSQVLTSLLPDTIALILTASLIFCWLRKQSVWVHNLSMILGIAGIAVFLGLSLRPETALAFLIILSVYDFIAVYKTKHMVRMAEEMISVGAVLALIIPRDITSFGASLKEIKPGGKFVILGGGDMALPLMLCFSLFPESATASFIVAEFVLLGIFASSYLFVSQKTRRPIPALPPIALFSAVGFLVSRLFTM